MKSTVAHYSDRKKGAGILNGGRESLTRHGTKLHDWEKSRFFHIGILRVLSDWVVVHHDPISVSVYNIKKNIIITKDE